jgi:hypothetical protein
MTAEITVGIRHPDVENHQTEKLRPEDDSG